MFLPVYGGPKASLANHLPRRAEPPARGSATSELLPHSNSKPQPAGAAAFGRPGDTPYSALQFYDISEKVKTAKDKRNPAGPAVAAAR